jgi:hypothetical protein
MKKNIFYLFGTMLFCSFAFSQNAGYMKNDLHQHTTFTDGWYSLSTMMYMNNKYGLDFWANSEHGGSFARSGLGPLVTTPPFTKDTVWDDAVDSKWWDSYSPNPIKGVYSAGKNKHQRMWRWQSLKDYSFPQLLKERELYSDKTIFEGLEWNIPSHEHCSVVVLGDQFSKDKNVKALAEFEYKFDAGDNDTLGGKEFGWTKSTKNDHLKALEALKWLNENHPKDSYAIINHPERRKKYTIADFRDFNNVAPEICFGHEAIPGHQKDKAKGEYVNSETAGECTYGGAGIYLAKLGGVWDALLGEGRRWFIFTNSDCHMVGKTNEMSDGEDFFPGEYAKNYTYVENNKNPLSLIEGLKSGNSWIGTGDLIDSLDFRIDGKPMGSTITPGNSLITITILVRDPNTNNFNTYSDYKNPVLDHIDLIAGKVTSKAAPGSHEYSVDSNSTTRVIARFDSTGRTRDFNRLASKKWETLPDGIKRMSLTLIISSNMYFRLRGTNHPLGTENETDGTGNPLPDILIKNDAAAAFSDLWFYSNPIFVKIK